MGDLLEMGQSQEHESMSLTCHLWSTVAPHPLLVLSEIPSVSHKALFQWQVYSISICFFNVFHHKRLLLWSVMGNCYMLELHYLFKLAGHKNFGCRVLRVAPA